MLTVAVGGLPQRGTTVVTIACNPEYESWFLVTDKDMAEVLRTMIQHALDKPHEWLPSSVDASAYQQLVVMAQWFDDARGNMPEDL